VKKSENTSGVSEFVDLDNSSSERVLDLNVPLMAYQAFIMLPWHPGIMDSVHWEAILTKVIKIIIS